jgi:hypothetical protein
VCVGGGAGEGFVFAACVWVVGGCCVCGGDLADAQEVLEGSDDVEAPVGGCVCVCVCVCVYE